MPRPAKGEKKKKFVSRAIKEFREEGIPQKEAVGRAFGFWRTYAGKPRERSIKNMK